MFTSLLRKGYVRQYCASITVNLGMMIGGEYYAWPSPALSKIFQGDAPFHMTHSDVTWMVSLLYVGNTLGPIPAGYLMDRFGRKTSLIYCSILPITSWILILFATCPLHLHCARLLGGLWVGIITTVAPMYTGEISEPSIRGGLGNIFSLLTYLGTLFIYAIGPYVSYHSLAIIAEIIPIYFLLMLILMPESPYYLLMHNKKEEARESLRWLRGDIDDEKLEQEVIEMEASVLNQASKGKKSLLDIFRSRANRKAFLIVQLYAIFVKFAGIGLIMAFSSITLPKSAFKSMGPHECTIILASSWVVSSMFSVVLVDRIGRKILLAASSLGCCITMFIAGLWFYLDANTSVKVDHISYVPFVCFLLHGFLYSVGLGPVGTAIKGELLSASIRGSASAATTVTFALASVILNQIYLPAADHIGMFVNYWLYSISCLISTIFTICVFFETKGKTLQEIQNKLAKRTKKHGIVSEHGKVPDCNIQEKYNVETRTQIKC